MPAITFSGDAFSEYYLTRLLWDEPRLRSLLGQDTVQASFRRAAAEVLRAQRALRARQQARSTRTLLLDPLCNILGWTLGDPSTVETAEGTEDAGFPLQVEDRCVARVLAIAPDAPLDLPPIGIHRRFAPILSMVRVLEELDLAWGVIVNAYELRIIRRAEGFIASHAAFDLTAIAEGTAPGSEAWRLIWALLRDDALAAVPPLLDRAIEIGRQHQEGVGTALGRQVQEAVVGFLQRILDHPDNAARRTEQTQLDDMGRLYAEALRVLYRTLFTLYAEARNLLPVDMPTYRDGYAVSLLARRATDPDTDPRQHPSPSGRFFEFSLRALFDLLRVGVDLGPEGRIPKYDGALFDHSRTELIESLTWGDEAVAHVLDKLTLIPGRASGIVRLSYRELDVEQLGAIYETLLEQTPQVAGDVMYRASLDNRELVLSASDRERLARRRGELIVGDVPAPEDEEEESDIDEGEADAATDDESGDEELGEETRANRKPLRVLAEIPAGTVFLRAGFGRKQTGSFYTSRPLVEFLVREAIDPLAEGKSPEEILALRVLDCAMGSGHFLVGACRRLSEHLLAAYRENVEAVTAAQSGLAPPDLFAEAGVHPAVAAAWDYEDRALTACRLLIAGNCLYGVDKNPLAVDLARVSLWLATAATDHPLTFLDHRLRIGDSLLGLPLYLGDGEEPAVHLLKPDINPAGSGRRGRRAQEERETPLLDGVPVTEIITGTTRHLRERIRRAMVHLRTIRQISEDHPGDFAGQRTAFEAMQGELKPFDELHALCIGRRFAPPTTPAEATAFDQYLVDIAQQGRVGDAARQAGEEAYARGRDVGAFCWPLVFPEVFFNDQPEQRTDAGFDVVIGNPPWDKIKPNERECFSDFDPTVWDVQGQARKRLITSLCRDNPAARAAWERHETEVKTTSEFLLDGGVYHHQVAVVEGRKTGGDPDTFKFFLERAWQLLHDGGRAGLIVPLGIQASLGTTGLRRLLLDECCLAALCKLDNERKIFPGVFHGQKFDLVAFAKGGRTGSFSAAFFSWEPADVLLRLRTDRRHLTVDADLYRELSPEQYTFVELHDQREVEMLRRIYREFPRLGERREDTWNVSFTAEFHMTNDSFLFRDAARLRRMGAKLHSRLPPVTEAAQGASFELDEGGEFWTTPDEAWYAERSNQFARVERWIDNRGRPHLQGGIDDARVKHRLTGYVLLVEADDLEALPIRPAERYVPLYEGRMVHQFDHCQKAYVTGSGRRAKWIELGWDEKRIVPHYFMARIDFLQSRAERAVARPTFGAVTGQMNERSLLTSLVPPVPCGNSLPTAGFDNCSPLLAAEWCAVANSFVVDWLLRLRISNNINFFVLQGLAWPRLEPGSMDLTPIALACFRLTCTTPELRSSLAGVARFLAPDNTTQDDSVSACTDPVERARLRAELDARVTRLYGLTAVEYARVLSTFPLLDQDQPSLSGDQFIRMTNKGEKSEPRGFITRDLALLTFFDLIGEAPPTDIVAFFADAGVDIDRQTGPVRDLRERVEEATRRGAVAYIPSTGKGWKPAETPFLPPDLPVDLAQDWDGHIDAYVVRDPQINAGEPTLTGTRITVDLVADLLSRGWTFRQVLESYPHLSAQQVAVAFWWRQQG